MRKLDKDLSVDDILKEVELSGKSSNDNHDFFDKHEIDFIINDILNEKSEKVDESFLENVGIESELNKSEETYDGLDDFLNTVKSDNKSYDYSIDENYINDEVDYLKSKGDYKFKIDDDTKNDIDDYSFYINEDSDSVNMDNLLNEVAKKTLRKSIEDSTEKNPFFTKFFSKFNKQLENDSNDEGEVDFNENLTNPVKVLKNIKSMYTNLFFRLSVLIFLFVLSVYYAASSVYPKIPIFPFLDVKTAPFVFAVFNLGFLIMAISVSYTAIIDGLIAFFRFEPDRDAIVSLSVLVCFIQNLVFLFYPEIVLREDVHLYSSIAIGILLFNTTGKIFIVKRALDNYRSIYSKSSKSALDIEMNDDSSYSLTRGVRKSDPVLVFNKRVDLFKGFVEKSFGIDILDRIFKLLSPISVLVAAFIAIIVSLRSGNIYVGITSFTGVICMFSPFCIILCVYLPVFRANRKLSKDGAGIIGISDIEDCGHVNCVAIDAYNIFPEGSIVLNGIETFSGQRIDEAIIDAASVICQSRSVLSHVFMEILLNRKELLRPIDSVVYEDKKGVSAWVNNKRILIGTRDLLISHGVKVPIKKPEEMYHGTNTRIIYLATSGELTAIFILTVNPDDKILNAFRELENNNVTGIIKTVDPIIDSKLFTVIFNVKPELFNIIHVDQHAEYDKCLNDNKGVSGTVINDGTFCSYINSLIVSKKLKNTLMFSTMSLMVCIIVGVILIFLLGLFGGISQINIWVFVVYQLFWIFPSYIFYYLKR